MDKGIDIDALVSAYADVFATKAAELDEKGTGNIGSRPNTKENTSDFNKKLEEAGHKLIRAALGKAIEMIPTIGGPLSDIITGLLEPEEPDELKMTLENINKKLDNIDARARESMPLMFVTDAHNEAQKLNSTINFIFEKLQAASKRGDVKEFYNVLRTIDAGKNELDLNLYNLHDKLVKDKPKLTNKDGDTLNYPLLDYIRMQLEQRALDVNGSFSYNINKYQGQMRQWYDYFADIQERGAALLVIYRRCMDLTRWTNFSATTEKEKAVAEKAKANTLCYEQDCQNKFQERLKTYNQKLLRGWLFDRPAVQVIKNLMQSSKDDMLPKFYTLRRDNGEYLGVELMQHKLPRHGSQPQKYEEYSVFAPCLQSSEKNDFRAALRPVFDDDKGVFTLAANRHKHGFECPQNTFLTRDTRYDPQKERPGVGGSGPRAYFKFIPFEDSDRIRVVLINRAGDGKQEVWDCKLEPSSILDGGRLVYTGPDCSAEIHNIASRPMFDAYRCWLWVDNFIDDHVLVLQDIRLNDGEVETLQHVWLSGQAHPIVWYAGYLVEGLLKFAIYKIHPKDKAKDASFIREYIRFDAHRNRLTMAPDIAEHVCNLICKVEVPHGWLSNKMSTKLLGKDEEMGQLPFQTDKLYGRTLGEKLDEFEYSSGNRRDFDGYGFHVTCAIEKGDVTGGQLRLTKG